jgi:arginyl-tRNA synthetase
MSLLERTVAGLRQALRRAAAAQGWELDPAQVLLESPRDPAHGDLASTVALALAGRLGRRPREVAETLQRALQADPPPGVPIAAIEVAGPGFLNFRMAPEWLAGALDEVLVKGAGYGRSDRLAGRSVLFEFVSANPTGPLNVVSARAAAVGDALAALWATAGARVGREFYVNDAGRQVRLLGLSLEARVRQRLGEEAPLPEEGYHGDYLVELADQFLAGGLPEWWTTQPAVHDPGEEGEGGGRCDRLADWAIERIVERQRRALAAFGLRFDTWFRESSLHASGAVTATLDELKARGVTFEAEGALWFRSSALGDEKDRVLLTGDGRPTYLLPDIAYHRDKYVRGWASLVDLWGPDHHGYIPRMTAALQALGHEPESFRVLIVQQVNLLRGGQVVKMSKRAGRLIEMEELLEEVGVDAARFFFLMRGTSTHLDFDLDLAVARNEENPVYYVQYAHARICSILERASAEGLDVPLLIREADLTRLVEPEERTLLRLVADYPETVADAAVALEPQRLTTTLRELAAAFHPFYHRHRVLGAPDDLPAARLALCQGVRTTLANGLTLLGISAPERM